MASHQSKKNKPWILVDCGEATQHQLLQTNLSVHQLSLICITHVHGDHCYGLPGLLASMAMSGRKDPITIIAPQAIAPFLAAVKATTELYFPFPVEFVAIETLFNEDLEANKDLDQHQHPKQNITQSGSNKITVTLSATHQLDIEVIKLSHRVQSYAFKISQKVQTIKLDVDKLKADGIEPSAAWGKLQAGEDVIVNEGTDNAGKLKSLDYTKRMTQKLQIIVAGDNDTPELLTHAVKGIGLLVHEATYTQAVADKIMSRTDAFDPMHTTVKRIASFAQSVELENLILTHFSARYQPYDDPESKTPNMADIRLEAEQYYQGNLWLAQDFARFEVSSKGVKQLPNLKP